ncbi:hypothetical protein JKG47_10560, partial [Acidithiobacillus sp. MC6.1]|nr:hypothetical protein [Acidithiobacillus sp. MC6.1]
MGKSSQHTHRATLRRATFDINRGIRAACILALPPYIVTRLPEGFSHFVTSIAAPVASGWSTWPGGACTRWKTPPLHGARH